jgi:hypothetical protein
MEKKIEEEVLTFIGVASELTLAYSGPNYEVGDGSKD